MKVQHNQPFVFGVVCLQALLSSTSAFLPKPVSQTGLSSTSSYSRSNVHSQSQHPFRRISSLLLAEPAVEESVMQEDTAASTPQLLRGVWQQIAAGASMVRGESATVAYPNMEARLNQPKYLNVFMAHLDACKDVCDHFGITTILVPYKEGDKCLGFTVKSYRNPDRDPHSFEFEYDPFWDDGTDYDTLYEGIDDELVKEVKQTLPEIENKIPDDDDEIISISKTWVSKLMSDMGICPFTQGAEKAGLPMGPVYYCVDRCSGVEDMYARYWDEVVRVEQTSESELSTTLLIAPEFHIDNVELYESWSNTLTQPLTVLGVESLLQLVFFHPQWSFRDGGARSGLGNAANYARRSPWPMINILRTKQVRAAQAGIPTGLVYTQNEKTLAKVGAELLESMLRQRDWEPVKDVVVNRRDREALRVAKDFQSSGEVKLEDTTFANDATPAAGRVDVKQVEQGNLMTVLEEALAKRVGKKGPVESLSGPETSATSLAADFLLAELESIIGK